MRTGNKRINLDPAADIAAGGVNERDGGAGGTQVTTTLDEDKVVKFESFQDKIELAEIPKEEKETYDDTSGDTKTDGEGKTGDVKESNSDYIQEGKTEGQLEPIPPLQQQQQGKDVQVQQFADKELEEFPLNDYEKRILKQMSKEARQFVTARLRTEKKAVSETKVLRDELTNERNNREGKLPQSYLEHEDAYQFSPQYKEAAFISERAGVELDFWKQQINRIEKGERWNQLIYNSKTGYSVGQEFEPSTEAKNDILDKIHDMKLLLNDKQKQIGEIRSGHLQQHRTYIQQFSELEDKYFPHFKDNEKLKGTATEKYLSTAQKLLKDLGQEKNPLFGLTAKLYTHLMDVVNAYNKREGEWNKNQQILSDRTKAGPTSSELTKGGTGNVNGGGRVITGSDDEVVNFDLFRQGRE